ncbi:bifunctional serine/threonine-protein kinase/formylglycine-generating enzyme family protein [Dolichospermum sp. ST_sed1]|nr:bifunctional serine/threonine-protein kinase/formylglycine-generating enzyme family protein [Dolichospermum sp. ST_sed1]MDD1427465.1 bifunctional serine/threonine-protein kinase/formylglycine-generating enzyme family protein [Dolichospermum sp. ST_sed9]MDD1433319.1 bifunctional serine/threonine-protein kinase/formylglycine-generating enzyme family protein [Dolichospermum sp. ST_sed6]MDD1442682.1 bifunctional serine/threonine-protein kinase/formylglycine-generating enzyme family protein [Dolic
MICCLNPDCSQPINPDDNKFCQSCRTPLIPLLINRFRVLRVLSAEGGFGRTYLAEDSQKLNETCVIKQLAPKQSGTYALKKATELFIEEAKRLQDLGEHAQIPTLFAYFEDNGFLYLVQQFIKGENLLDELKQKGKYKETQIRELLLDLLPSLKFIHERQVIHRDIKPQNIMRRASDGKLVLIDFGASKQLTTTVHTQIGTQIGSYGYSPLEQIQGGEAYPASDLFALGATCFHLLTGDSPFQLWTINGFSWVNNWRQYLPSPVSQELGKVLDKLLKVEIRERYQSADKVIKDLEISPTFVVSPGGNKNQSLGNSPTTINRRGFIYGGLFLGGVTVAFMGQNLFSGKQNQTSISDNLKTFSFEVVSTNATGNIINRRNESAKYFTEDLGNGVTLEMVEIPGGTFIMGSPENQAGWLLDERPQHQVTVPSFFMAKYELTQAQYQAIMGSNPSRFKGNNRPVERVSWNNAVAFCQRLSQKTQKNYRLPSEAEWEYACRAGTTTPFYFGESINPELVNYNGNYTYGSAPKGQYRQQTTDVGSFPPNAFGLYDMHGNVWEWCLDDYIGNYSDAPKDGNALTGQSGLKMGRGGSWVNNPQYCRSASRNSYTRDERGNLNYLIGFRVACTVART